MLILTCTCR